MDLKFVITAANEVCEGFVFTGVCMSTGGGMHEGGVHGRGGMHGGGCLWQGGMHGIGACVAGGGPSWQIPRDTVNERAVRILLDCILVFLLSLLQQSLVSAQEVLVVKS